MITVEREPLLVQALELFEEVNGAFEVTLTSLPDAINVGHHLLKEESLISVDGYDFKVKQYHEDEGIKDIVAISTFYDLVGHRQEGIYGGTHTLDEFANFVFNGTGWTFTSDVSGYALIPNFGTDNVIKLVQALCQAFECEVKIMRDNHVHFSKQIGPDNDTQYRYGHNVKALSKSVDTTNLRTKIKGYGAENLVVTYVSPNAEIFGVIEADPISDDRFTIGENLVEHIKKGLIDYPEVSLEMDTVELTNKELGERVWLIYEPLNIEFQTRVLAKKSTMRNGELVTVSVVLGNSMPKNLGDILASQKVEIDENKKQVMSRIEQTNDRITLEVEEVNSSIAGLEITIGEVRIYAEELEDSIAEVNVRADNITLSVQSLGNRLGSAESQLSIQAGEIASKVSETDFNGNTMISRINQTAGSVTIQANRINMLGITEIADTLYIGGNWRDSTHKSLHFRGASGGVSISSPGIDVLDIHAVGYVQLGSRTNFNGTVDFSNASVIGLNNNTNYASNAGNAYSLNGYDQNDFLKLESHQIGTRMVVSGSGALQITVNGRTATYTPSSWS